MNLIEAPTPAILIQEISPTQCSFTFPSHYAERFMESILTDHPESKFYVIEPDDMSRN